MFIKPNTLLLNFFFILILCFTSNVTNGLDRLVLDGVRKWSGNEYPPPRGSLGSLINYEFKKGSFSIYKNPGDDNPYADIMDNKLTTSDGNTLCILGYKNIGNIPACEFAYKITDNSNCGIGGNIAYFSKKSINGDTWYKIQSMDREDWIKSYDNLDEINLEDQILKFSKEGRLSFIFSPDNLVISDKIYSKGEKLSLLIYKALGVDSSTNAKLPYLTNNVEVEQIIRDKKVPYAKLNYEIYSGNKTILKGNGYIKLYNSDNGFLNLWERPCE